MMSNIVDSDGDSKLRQHFSLLAEKINIPKLLLKTQHFQALAENLPIAEAHFGTNIETWSLATGIS